MHNVDSTATVLSARKQGWVRDPGGDVQLPGGGTWELRQEAEEPKKSKGGVEAAAAAVGPGPRTKAVRSLRFKSQPLLFLVVWPWAGDFTPLCLGFLI